MKSCMDEMDGFDTLTEAMVHQSASGGILLILKGQKYGVCTCCLNDDMENGCGRSDEWLASLEPSWSEAAPENARRDPRNNTKNGQSIEQPEMF